MQINNKEDKALAMAFATSNKDEIHIKKLLGEDNHAIEMAMGCVKNELEKDLPMLVWRRPSQSILQLRARGMLRIINVERILTAIAKSYPNLTISISVRDRYIPENNAVFQVKAGECAKTNSTKIKCNIDVTIDVLAKILFNSDKIGEVFNLPAVRPSMFLMLD